MFTWLLFNIPTINFWYAIAGLICLALTAVLVFDYTYNKQKLYTTHIAPYIWLLLSGVILGAVATTLLYSEILGFVPCSLCWLQRVALYPQVFLLIAAYKIKDTTYFPRYGMVLSIFGLAVAVYQYIYQALPQELHDAGLLPCLADGSSDCAKKVMELFGFVTFPFLSAVIFAFLIILYMHILRAGKKE